jgi:hypothetical protein
MWSQDGMLYMDTLNIVNVTCISLPSCCCISQYLHTDPTFVIANTYSRLDTTIRFLLFWNASKAIQIPIRRACLYDNRIQDTTHTRHSHAWSVLHICHPKYLYRSRGNSEFEQAQGIQEYLELADGKQQKCDLKWRGSDVETDVRMRLRASDTNSKIRKIRSIRLPCNRSLVPKKRNRTWRHVMEIDLATELHMEYRRTRCFICWESGCSGHVLSLSLLKFLVSWFWLTWAHWWPNAVDYITVWNKIYFNYVRFQVLTTASLKMTAFWDVASCSLVDVDGRFRGAYCRQHQRDDGSTHLWNVGLLPRDYTVIHPRNLSSSCFD